MTPVKGFRLHGRTLCLLVFSVVMLASSIVFLAPGTEAKSAFAIKPTPSWVKPVTVAKATSSATGEASGSLYLLSDSQTRVSSGSTERYLRRVKKVLNASGLEDLSQLQLEFEPSYEQLIIHHVRIFRGETTIDALNPNEIKTIQQENDLNQRIYNGTLSALIFLNDVRVGDTVDYAFSVVGDNPVMGGRFATNFNLASSQYVGKMQWRLLWPSKRSLRYHGLNTNISPAVQQIGDETEYVWSQNDVEAIEIEDNIPRWFRPIPTFQLSEFADWADVVKWELPLYTLKQPIDSSLKDQIEEWRSESTDPEKRLMSATRFVQDEVRYMGIELGPSSHTPTHPSIVFKRRFGDCKDKTLLLSTILNSLGIEATPALVNTNAQHTLDSYQPTPLAFDHVILQVRLNSKTFWLDATASLQRGSLAEQSDLDYERALVLRDGTHNLEEIPQAVGNEPTVVLHEVYKALNYDAPALLDVTTTYKGHDADDIRSSIAQQTAAELAKTCLNYYASSDADIQAVGPPEVSDDTNLNVLIITEHYKIPGFWKNRAREFYASRINEELAKPNVSKRSMPLALAYPVSVSQIIEVHLPESFAIKKAGSTIESDAVRYRYQYDSSGNTVTLNYQLQTKKNYIYSAGVAEHLALIDRIRGTLGYEISRDQADDGDLTALLVLGLIATPLLIVGVTKAVKSNRLRKAAFKHRTQPRHGESPETAIQIAPDADVYQNLSGFRCACGSSYPSNTRAAQTESAVFDGRKLTIIRLNCEKCSRFRDVYFVNPNPILQD